MRELLVSILFIPYIISLLLTNGGFTESPNKSFTKMESVSSDTIVKMERTVCFGTCPSYTLSIQKNGRVTFYGKEFVEHKGMATGQIPQDSLDKLIQKIKESHFFETPSDPECESRYTDMPSVYLTIRLDDDEHSVAHYHGCKGFMYETELYELEEAVDSIAGTKKWIEDE
jgi:hypothetical protein